MPEFNSNLRALNNIMADYGLAAGRRFEIDAWNALAVHFGGAGGHQFNIDALNEIIGLVDGNGTFQFEIDAINEVSRVFGGRSNFAFVEDALSEISDLPVFTPSEGGGGGDGALADINFVTESYDVGGDAVALGDIFATDVGDGTMFDAGDVVAGSGLKGANLGGTSIPSMIGALRSAIIGTVGCSVVVEFETEISPGGANFSLELFHAGDFDPYQYAIIEGADVIGFNFGVSIFVNSHDLVGGAINVVALTVSKTLFASKINDFPAAEQALDPQADWAAMQHVACYYNAFKYLRRLRVHPPKTAAELDAMLA